MITSTAGDLNKEHLMSIADDDVEFLEELWECFEEEYQKSYSDLKTAAEGKDKASATLNSHNIKSGSANLGAEKVQDIASGLEVAAKKEDYDTILESLSSLQSAYESLATTFTQWIESMK